MAARYNQQMVKKSLQKLRDYGFTACSGVPSIAYRGFDKGKPVLDFSLADTQMSLVKELGFKAVIGYGGGVSGLNAYSQDLGAMNSAAFTDYATFIRSIYSAVEEHAARKGWIPVCYNLADEPLGDDLVRSAENAEAYRRAFPRGPSYFTGASSFTGNNARDPHFRLSKAFMSSRGMATTRPACNYCTRRGRAGRFTTAAIDGLTGHTCTKPRSNMA